MYQTHQKIANKLIKIGPRKFLIKTENPNKGDSLRLFDEENPINQIKLNFSTLIFLLLQRPKKNPHRPELSTTSEVFQDRNKILGRSFFFPALFSQ